MLMAAASHPVYFCVCAGSFVSVKVFCQGSVCFMTEERSKAKPSYFRAMGKACSVTEFLKSEKPSYFFLIP